MSLFGSMNLMEFATTLQLGIAAFGNRKLPEGWDTVRMTDLGISQVGTTFTSPSGRGKAIVAEADGQLVVSFRGTDKKSDYKDYDNVSLSLDYFRQFENLLKKVDDYAEKHQLEVTFTGISLGAAVVNIIADKAASLMGGAFRDAHFVGMASPYLSGSRTADVYNFGFANDFVYHIAPGSWGTDERANATDNLFVYKNHKNWFIDSLDDRLSVHGAAKIADAVRALAELTLEDGRMLSDVLRIDSVVLFDDATQAVKAGKKQHAPGTVLTVIGEDRADRLYGAGDKVSGSSVEWFFGRGGNDVIVARAGADKLFGNGGNDKLVGGQGRDFMSGGNGNDLIWLQTHGDRAQGGAGNDGFVVSNILPLTVSGDSNVNGGRPAHLSIEDFQPGIDVINLRALDGNLAKRGMQDLHFAGYFEYDVSEGLGELEQGFVGDTSPGSVTIFHEKDGDTLVIINRDDDRGRELEIELDGDVGNIIRDLLL